MRSNGSNPYILGFLSGLLIILSVVISGNYFGTSTAFVQFTGMIESIFAPDQVSQMPYFQVVKPILSWQMMFVLGIGIGSFTASKLWGDFRFQWLPDLWQKRRGLSVSGRAFMAFAGGIIAMFGVRMAGGCPSGQMSAMILLSTSGLVAMTMFFAVGILVARLLYKGGNRA